MTKTSIFARSLRDGAALGALTLGAVLFAAPAMAQQVPTTTSTTPATPPATDPTQDQTAADQGQDIVVTGTLFKNTVTPSPVTTLTTDDLDRRGINTVQDAVQQLSSNNGPALTNSFTANGAFAGGASSVSLRGLSTNSTLVLFDGLRAAYYPLADDGSRNFVDLNTIPDDIVERVEVLRDGASSSYGADAIAGVVNIITKRSVKGVSGRAEAGISQNGVGANQRFTLTAGMGDLDTNGYNAYVSGFFYRSEAVYNRDLPAPFNTADESSLGGPNNVINGRNPDGSANLFGLPFDFYVRPYTNVGYANGVQNGGVATGRYQKLNPTSACVGGSSTSYSAAELANVGVSAPTGVVCQNDYVRDYQVVSPNIQRFGGSARITAKVNDTTEAYALFSYQQSDVNYTGYPGAIRGTANTGIISPSFSTSTAQNATLAPGSGVLALPIYVCPQRVNCTAANGTLNPNNPFASQGLVARLTGRLPEQTYNASRSRVYRGAIGIRGTVFDSWDYSVDAVAMHTDLRLINKGYVYIQHLLDVIADGTYNFVNPQNNSQAVRDYLTPTNITDDSSDLYQLQASVQHPLFDLPGGPLQLGVGGSVFYEAVDAPSANPDYNGPTQRYFTLNAFGTQGHRTVASVFGELNAPILDSLTVNLSGRYDHYSTGQSAFSPKAGFKFTPFRQVTLRGTYSRGFRIPSFGEANALPTTGYVSQAVGNIPANFRAQYNTPQNPNCGSAGTGCPAYLTAYSIGLTTLASPNLKPEKSRSFTAGILLEPIRNVSLTVDYYNIRKTGAITAPSSAPALAAYYAGAAIPAGYTVIADAPDPNFPNARPRIAFVASQLINANTIKSEGIDFGASGRFDVFGVKWTTNLDASLALELSTTFPDGTKETYVDTLGNFNLTAGSGTFRWRGNWQNTFDFGDIALTGTVNYTSGYDYSAQDQGTGYRDCGLSPQFTVDANGNPGPCRVHSYITVDANASFRVNDKFTFYVNVLNLLDRRPPIDGTTYGAYLYNPVQGGNGIIGRQFRAGAKFNF